MNADLAALSPELSKQSLSNERIILPQGAALKAIAELTRGGRRIESWEGWVRLRDGTRAKSLSHGGSFALARDPARAAAAATAGIQRAQSAWDRNPEFPDGSLYFALTFAGA